MLRRGDTVRYNKEFLRSLPIRIKNIEGATGEVTLIAKTFGFRLLAVKWADGFDYLPGNVLERNLEKVP